MKLALLVLLLYLSIPLISQDAGTLHFGPYARAESNLYKYQAKSTGEFISIRTTNGYSIGLALDAVLHYLVKMDVRLGFSEMNYSPDYINERNEVLYKHNIRAIQSAANAHLRLGKQEKFYPSMFLGVQVNTVRESTANGSFTGTDDLWTGTRSFGNLGLAGNFLLMKERLLLKAELGMRTKFIGKRKWENSPNQIFGGLTVGYRLKK